MRCVHAGRILQVLAMRWLHADFYLVNAPSTFGAWSKPISRSFKS
jgi:hypothetical protein